MAAGNGADAKRGRAEAEASAPPSASTSASSLADIPGLLPQTLSVRKLRRRRLTTLEQRRAYKKLKQLVAHDNELAAAERAKSRGSAQGGAAKRRPRGVHVRPRRLR